MTNDILIEKTVEIIAARMTNTTSIPDEKSGKNVAAFMQEIYNKLVDLNKNEDLSLFRQL